MTTLAIVMTAAIAMSGGAAPELEWCSVDGGGGTSTAGGFVLASTIGQSDAGRLSGGAFELIGGFWIAASAPSCVLADLNCDGVVDGSDLAIVLGSWGPCTGCIADMNHDGVVDGSDLTIVLGGWS